MKICFREWMYLIENLTRQQKYSIASTLATSSLKALLQRLAGNDEAMAFAVLIDRYFKKRDGFVPRASNCYCEF